MLDVRGRMPAMVFVYRFTPELRHNACQSRRAKLAFAPSSLPFPVPVTSFQCPGDAHVACPGYRRLVTDG